MLMERGQQYKRAIQLFMRASNNQRWPQNFDELESFNGKRFLRHRYKDPITGKDEWRLIHIQNGVLTDSVTNKPQNKKADDKDLLANQTVGDYGSSVGSYNPQDQGGAAYLNAATRRRPSDSNLPGTMPGATPAGAPMDPAQPGMNPPGQPGTTAAIPSGMPGGTGQPGQPGQPGLPPGLPGGVPGIPGAPSQLPPNQNNASNQGYSTVGNYGSIGSAPPPNTPNTPNMPNTPGGTTPQFPGMPGPPANSQNFGGTPAYPITAGANGLPPNYPQPGMQINPNQQSAAQNLIGSLLTTPRPGGLQNLNQGQVMGGGIAGVASKADADSIMVYHDRTNYDEWEFIFDPSKQRYPPPNPVSGASIGTPAAQLGSTPNGSMGTPAAQLGTPAGATPSSFGTPGASTPGVGPPAAGTPATTTGGAMPGMGGMGGTNSQPDIRPGRK